VARKDKTDCKTLPENRKFKPNINDAQHPSRQKAIKILEAIAEEMGQAHHL
jgi:hypothetical protein